jgi:hypothetical protein
MSISKWMSWEGGVDLVAVTSPDLAMPNVIVHVARMVHTPVGSAASGMVFYQADPNAMPLFMGFISTDEKVGAYFGPNIFAGTPFENAPVIKAEIAINLELPDAVSAKIVIPGFTIESHLRGVGALEVIHREPGPMPFVQQGLEAGITTASVKVNGEEISIIVPPVGMSGGAAAVFSPCGLYAR